MSFLALGELPYIFYNHHVLDTPYECMDNFDFSLVKSLLFLNPLLFVRGLLISDFFLVSSFFLYFAYSGRFSAFPLVFCVVRRLRPTVGGLAFGRGNAKARTGDKLSNSRKTFREVTPRLTPNRLLPAGIFCLFYSSVRVMTNSLSIVE